MNEGGILSGCLCPCGCGLKAWSICCMTCEVFHRKLIVEKLELQL